MDIRLRSFDKLQWRALLRNRFVVLLVTLAMLWPTCVCNHAFAGVGTASTHDTSKQTLTPMRLRLLPDAMGVAHNGPMRINHLVSPASSKKRWLDTRGAFASIALLSPIVMWADRDGKGDKETKSKERDRLNKGRFFNSPEDTDKKRAISRRDRTHRRKWRKAVRSPAMAGANGMGADRLRTDKRATLFFTPRDPNMPKKVRTRYYDKIYKVIQEALPSGVEETVPVAMHPELHYNLDETQQHEFTAPEQFVQPMLWNQNKFRGATLLASAALAGGALPFAAMLHVCAYGIWLGAAFWTTFIAGITMFKFLPKQQFGKLQAQLFPKYFQLGTFCTVIMVFTSMRLRLSAFPASAALIGTLANLLYLEPQTRKVMLQRYDRENAGLKDATIDRSLKSQFGRLHGVSSFVNLVVLISLIAHGSLLAARL